MCGLLFGYQDAFNEIGEDDAPLIKMNENENELKELRTFTDLVHSKNKVSAGGYGVLLRCGRYTVLICGVCLSQTRKP